jgi:hypothetical protein
MRTIICVLVLSINYMSNSSNNTQFSRCRIGAVLNVQTVLQLLQLTLLLES